MGIEKQNGAYCVHCNGDQHADLRFENQAEAVAQFVLRCIQLVSCALSRPV